jgi:hypothetical protein
MKTSTPLHHHYNDGAFHRGCARCKLDRARKVAVAYEPGHGNLVLSVIPSEVPRLRRLGRGHPQTCVAEASFIKDYLVPLGFVQVKPEDVGALTFRPVSAEPQGRGLRVYGVSGPEFPGGVNQRPLG